MIYFRKGPWKLSLSGREWIGADLIAPGHERAFRHLLGAVKPLVALHGSLPFPWVLTFLTVAVEEGKSVGAYARELNVNRFLMSRYIRRIAIVHETVGLVSD